MPPCPCPTGELFDFDVEVEPILEVLVGRVLEQGLMEVMEEEELAAMRAHQRQMQALRDAGKPASGRRPPWLLSMHCGTVIMQLSDK